MTSLLGLPAWMEILVNVIGYAGFIGIAMVIREGGDGPGQDQRT